MTLLAPDLSLHGASDPVVQATARTHAGMAHFAGTGPAGTTCKQCRFMQAYGNPKLGRCAKYRDLMHGQSGQKFPHATPSCKHFGAER